MIVDSGQNGYSFSHLLSDVMKGSPNGQKNTCDKAKEIIEEWYDAYIKSENDGALQNNVELRDLINRYKPMLLSESSIFFALNPSNDQVIRSSIRSEIEVLLKNLEIARGTIWNYVKSNACLQNCLPKDGNYDKIEAILRRDLDWVAPPPEQFFSETFLNYGETL